MNYSDFKSDRIILVCNKIFILIATNGNNTFQFSNKDDHAINKLRK